MRILAFILFVLGLVFWWPLAVFGFILYEAAGVTWIAAATSVDSHDDHGP